MTADAILAFWGAVTVAAAFGSAVGCLPDARRDWTAHRPQVIGAYLLLVCFAAVGTLAFYAGIRR